MSSQEVRDVELVTLIWMTLMLSSKLIRAFHVWAIKVILHITVMLMFGCCVHIENCVPECGLKRFKVTTCITNVAPFFSEILFVRTSQLNMFAGEQP